MDAQRRRAAQTAAMEATDGSQSPAAPCCGVADGNGHSHLQATWLGPEITVPVSRGQPVLGTWQQIFHLECDVKPRDRRIVVTVMGD